MISAALTSTRGGPAGSILASRLAKTPKAPSVLLLEAGTADTDPKALFIADRYTNFYKFPKYNWGYKTVPQPQLHDREIDYSRGKGLGGSTRINFATYTIGPKDDYDHWADLVEDDFFGWEKVQKRFVGFESFDLNVPERNRPYANPSSVMHGINNGVPVSYPPVLQDGLTDMFDVVEKHGIPVNLDLNSGDPIGMALSPTAGLNGYRATAQTAFLKDGNIPMNLTIVTSAFATKIILEGKKAVGIEAGGKSCMYAYLLHLIIFLRLMIS
jgi:choline dehydrogenase-like flavoprotein